MKRQGPVPVRALLSIIAIGLAMLLTLALAGTAAASTLNEYPTTGNSQPWGICAGPDGNIWFAEMYTSKIGKMKTDGTLLAEYGTNGTSYPDGICAGPDGNIWFPEWAKNKIAKMDTDGTILAEYQLTTTGTGCGPEFICVGPDGNMWFTEYNGNRVGKIKTDGTGLAEYTVGGGANVLPLGICSGPDGNIWFTEMLANRICKIKTDGTGLAEYATNGATKPYGLCAGPDGNIWFGEATNYVAKIKTDGTGYTEYPVTARSYPNGFCVGPDGNIWFAESGWCGNEIDQIGKIRTDGTGYTEYPTSKNSAPTGICVGPDGNTWFTEIYIKKIGKLDYHDAPTITSPVTPNTGTSGTTVSITNLGGTGFYGTPTVLLKKTGQTSIAATDVAVVSSTQITCNIPIPLGASTGAWDVYVQNLDGQSATLAGGFTVDNTHTISASANPATGGTVSGDGTYTYGATVTMGATPSTGYHFVNWTENGSEVSTDPNYQFIITTDRTLVGNFALDTHTVTVSANPVSGGAYSGDGTYTYGDTVQMGVTTNPGFHFVNWTENGSEVSTDPNYSFTITSDRTLVGNFAMDTHTISASANPTAGGTVSGDGTYNYGDTATMGATPSTGYHFMNWTENGTQVSTDPNYSFTITTDRTLVGNFALDTHTVTVSANPVSGGAYLGDGTYNYNDTVTMGATPNPNYHFVNWTEGGSEVSTDPNYSFTVTADRTLVANFALDTHTISASANPAAGGNVSGAGTYNYKDTVTMGATPNPNYHFVNWTEGGNPVSTDPNYSFTATADRTLVANFALDTHTISASANPAAGGNVSGAGTYNYNDTVTMGATPNPNYHFVNWTEGGNPVSTDPNYSFTATADRTLVGNFSNVYNIKVYAVSVGGVGGTVTGGGNYSPDATVTIHATPDPGFHFINWTENGTKISTDPNYTFAAASDRTITGNFAIDTYTVTASVSGGHGNVAPPTQTVNYGSNATVTITPDTDYHVETITDNGVQETFTNQYVINNVTADHNVVVTFGINVSAFYFAEGTTRDNFAEYLCIGNPNDSDTSANVTYMFSDGTTKDVKYTLPAISRYTVNVNDAVGPDKDVSIRILSSAPNLVAERPMYFNYKGVWTGGSDALGAIAPTPKKNWYFAEGNTLSEFDQYVTVLNPGAVGANLTFHYLVEGRGEKTVTGTVGAHSRATFKTRDQIGSGLNDSLYLESDQPVVAERPMYFNYLGLAMDNWTGGSDAAGTNSPNTDWYFAEGTTRNNSIDGAFEQWLCLQNPSASPITVNATYQLAAGQGGPVSKSYTIPAQQRLTVSVNREIGADKDSSVHLHSSSGFIAERPMYFSYHPYAWTGGHDVLGANGTAKTWFFAEGTTRQNGTDGTFDEWLCLQNPGKDEAHVVITYYLASGQTINKNWTVNANTRLTVSANSDVGADQDISAKITSDQPIIAERPMYFNYHNVWTGGHDVVGFVPTQ